MTHERYEIFNKAVANPILFIWIRAKCIRGEKDIWELICRRRYNVMLSRTSSRSYLRQESKVSRSCKPIISFFATSQMRSRRRRGVVSLLWNISEAVKIASRGSSAGFRCTPLNARNPVRSHSAAIRHSGLCGSFISKRVQMDGEDKIRFPSTGI